MLIFETNAFVMWTPQERREKFQEELAEYAILLEDFQTLGDHNEIHEYLRRAKSLHSRLDHAANYIEQINKEEEALSWNTTHYPLRKQVRLCLGTPITIQPGSKLLEHHRLSTVEGGAGLLEHHLLSTGSR